MISKRFSIVLTAQEDELPHVVVFILLYVPLLHAVFKYISLGIDVSVALSVFGLNDINNNRPLIITTIEAVQQKMVSKTSLYKNIINIKIAKS